MDRAGAVPDHDPVAVGELSNRFAIDEHRPALQHDGLISGDGAMKRVEEFGAIYERVSLEAAQRAIRFWKIRSKI